MAIDVVAGSTRGVTRARLTCVSMRCARETLTSVPRAEKVQHRPVPLFWTGSDGRGSSIRVLDDAEDDKIEEQADDAGRTVAMPTQTLWDGQVGCDRTTVARKE